MFELQHSVIGLPNNIPGRIPWLVRELFHQSRRAQNEWRDYWWHHILQKLSCYWHFTRGIYRWRRWVSITEGQFFLLTWTSCWASNKTMEFPVIWDAMAFICRHNYQVKAPPPFELCLADRSWTPLGIRKNLHRDRCSCKLWSMEILNTRTDIRVFPRTRGM